MVRVLVVDDSAFARLVVSRKLEADPDISVVGHAINGDEAVTLVTRLKPDVVTMDVEMPGTDGLTALKRIMARQPVPVVMFSSLTGEGTVTTLRALELGAVDFILKPSMAGTAGWVSVTPELHSKIKAAAKVKADALKRLVTPVAAAADAGPGKRPGPRLAMKNLVLVGTSTGGPKALVDLFSDLPGDLPVGYVIVQHMPAGFTTSLAKRLDQLSAVHVREAQEGDHVETGVALLAPGGRHLTIERGGRVKIEDGPPVNGVRPSVDLAMQAAAKVYGDKTLGVILTGMGADGTNGSRLVKNAGGRIIAEHESSCTVYGMPKAVVDAGLADQIIPLRRIAAAITETIGAGKRAA